MEKKRPLVILLTALWGCLILLGGCTPQTGNPASTPTPGPSQSHDTSSFLPEDQDLNGSWEQEGVLVELAGYTDGEDEWAVLHGQSELTLLTVTPEIQVVGGPLEEGQRVAVTCLEILETYPSSFYQASKVEVLEPLTSEEWEEASATVKEAEESLEELGK
ncbi:unknown [Clostridium sp. CAG:1013]|nr:unknown [Clostridium sp. CAG:1013]